MASERRGLSTVWKEEDWLGVWIGFFIIIIVLLGLVTITVPKFKWNTAGQFQEFCKTASHQVEGFGNKAGDKGEAAVESAAMALKEALDKTDRAAIRDAVKKLEAAAKEAKDAEVKKDAAKFGKNIKGVAGTTAAKVFSPENIKWSIYIGIGILILSIIAMALTGQNVGLFIIGFPILFILAWIGMFIAGNLTVTHYGLEYVIWCLFLGLFVSNVIGLPDWLKPAVQTEFYIKTGLVILGSGILFKEILQAGALGIVQAVLVVGVIWCACYWIATKMGVDEQFSAILSSAVAICGVSAAIATSGAVKGDPKKLSYATSIVLICAVPMLVFQPAFAKWVGMPGAVAGAWLGGTLDTSGSVVAAGSLIGEVALKVGVIVKMSQNVLIGVVAFILAIIWTFKKAEEGPGVEKPGAMEIWYRFPKFVLGFIVASILFSFFLDPGTVGRVKGTLGDIRTIWFALAFTSIGLETRFAELTTLGGGTPAAAFLIAQVINILWTLLLAYLIFGGILFAAPAF